MEKIQFDLEPNSTENAEILWEKFEETGSVQTYLLYVQKMKNREEVVRAYLPT